MQIPENAKPYLQAVGGILFLALIIWWESKQPKFSCDAWAKSVKDDMEFGMILTKKENSNHSRNSDFYGIDINNKLTTEFHDGGGWISRNFDKFDIGDTIIKNKGEYTITIKRKGKTIPIYFECDRVYRDTIHLK